MSPPRCAFALIGLSLLLLAGCTGGRQTPSYQVATGGNPEQGSREIRAYGCGACHTIPGIEGARGMVGPPLISLARRTMIAGELPNSPENLVRWLKDPPSIEAGTAMPKLGLTDQQARDVAAYLSTLR